MLAPQPILKRVVLPIPRTLPKLPAVDPNPWMPTSALQARHTTTPAAPAPSGQQEPAPWEECAKTQGVHAAATVSGKLSPRQNLMTESSSGAGTSVAEDPYEQQHNQEPSEPVADERAVGFEREPPPTQPMGPSHPTLGDLGSPQTCLGKRTTRHRASEGQQRPLYQMAPH